MSNIFITGGAGYVGTSLVPKLLSSGHEVTVLDLMIYGENNLSIHKNLKIIKGDIRDQNLLKEHIKGHDIVIHLACISNDPSFELNPNLGKSINLDAFEPLVEISRDNNVERFIYASSSSVYGIKKEKNVHEGIALEPLTDYSKYKAECESILSKYNSDLFTTTTLRPATVCGYSKRQRLDVVVNILTNLGFHNRLIKVFGGNQLRPNIHIDDMVSAYENIISTDMKLVSNQIFNVGYDNQKVIDIALDVINVIGNDVKMEIIKTDDDRSYHISSDKIKNQIGFEPSKTVRDAIEDLKVVFEKKLLKNTLSNEYYFNIKRMQNINLK